MLWSPGRRILPLAARWRFAVAFAVNLALRHRPAELCHAGVRHLRVVADPQGSETQLFEVFKPLIRDGDADERQALRSFTPFRRSSLAVPDNLAILGQLCRI